MSILTYIRKNITWKDLYEKLCAEKAHVIHESLPTTMQSWEQVNSATDLTDFLRNNPNFGLLCFNHCKQILLLHSLITNTEDDTLIGTFGNNLEVIPIEISLPPEMFRSYQMTPVTQTPLDDPPAANETSTVSTASLPATNPSANPAHFQFKNIKGFLLVPPANVTHLLEWN